MGRAMGTLGRAQRRHSREWALGRRANCGERAPDGPTGLGGGLPTRRDAAVLSRGGGGGALVVLEETGASESEMSAFWRE